MPRAILGGGNGRLVELVGRVRATLRRGQKVELIADLLRQARGRETALLALYLTGTLPQDRVGVGWKALERLGEAAFEYKLDGARLQVHRAGDDVRVFTRPYAAGPRGLRWAASRGGRTCRRGGRSGRRVLA